MTIADILLVALNGALVPLFILLYMFMLMLVWIWMEQQPASLRHRHCANRRQTVRQQAAAMVRKWGYEDALAYALKQSRVELAVLQASELYACMGGTTRPKPTTVAAERWAKLVREIQADRFRQ